MHTWVPVCTYDVPHLVSVKGVDNVQAVMTSVALDPALVRVLLLGALADQGGEKVFVGDAEPLAQVAEHQGTVFFYLQDLCLVSGKQ